MMRLPERVLRLADWLTRAALGSLVSAGDPFELPQYATAGPREIFAYSEDSTSFSTWASLPVRSGYAVVPRIGKAQFVNAFTAPNGALLIKPDWGSNLRLTSSPERAIWLLLDDVLHVAPWGPPTSWKELRALLGERYPELEKLLGPFHHGQRALVFFGMPIPENIGEPNVQIHWQALRLPVLTSSAKLKGFRPTRKSFALADRMGPLSDDQLIEWLPSENWSEEQLSRRSANKWEVTGYILIIGCGALGSFVSELLFRQGLSRQILVDDDLVTAGTLVRNTLSMNDIGRNKAFALRDRLKEELPHGEVFAVNKHFDERFEHGLINEVSLIIDCTAEDDTLEAVEKSDLPPSASFISLSVTYGADQLIAFGSRCEELRFDDALRLIHGVLPQDDDMAVLIRSEGRGCYHPAFPADANRLASAAGMGLEFISHWLASNRDQEIQTIPLSYEGQSRFPRTG